MSDGNWLSPVRLLDSLVLGLNLDINQEFDGEATGITITLNTSFDELDRSEEFVLCRGVVEAVQTVTDAIDADKVAFTVSCSLGILVGMPLAALVEDVDDAVLKPMLEMNAISLGYGKVRAVIEDITAQSILGRVTLPGLDPQAYMDLIAANRQGIDEETE